MNNRYLLEPCLQRAVFQNLTFALLAFVLCGAIPVFADDDALDTLGFIEKSAEPLVTTSRTPRPLSQTAENVSVITSKEIESLNAHTLADILYTVSGIQVQHNGGPGITSYTYIVPDRKNQFSKIRSSFYDDKPSKISIK